MPFTTQPLSPATWPDFEALFGAKGACGGCWCMLWRLPRKDFETGKGEGNRLAMLQLVKSGQAPGIIGYLNGQPVAWCSVGPRTVFPGLERSRILKPVDEQPVWSISCLFVDRRFRRQGLSGNMIRAAADFARAGGANLLEAYPVEPRQAQMPDVFAWTGIAAPFLKAGFREIARRSEQRPILRLTL
jgi:GNAT superfamily N-acetyltransferase